MPTVKTRDGTDLYVKDWGSGRPRHPDPRLAAVGR